MSNPNPPAALPSRMFAGFGCLALAAYVVFLSFHTTVVVGGADSSGYFNSAKLFAAGELTTPLRAPAEFGARGSLDPLHFLPLGFTPAPDRATLLPTYPTGLPLLFALAGKVFGWELGARLVGLGGALAAVWLCYLTARRLGLGRPLAASGAAMLAAFPVFIFTSIQPLSDTLATTWTLLALYTLLRARGSADHAGWTLVGGGAFAMAVLIRPSNLLLAPALLVLLGLDWRRLALFVAGGAPGAWWQAWYNHRLYGSALRSGYGNIDEAFALSYVGPTALHFAHWLALLLPAVVLVLPFAALSRNLARRRELTALLLAFAAITGLYLSYEVSHEVWWCLRFILPGLPALILAALLGVEALARGPGARWPRWFRPVTALVLAGWAVGVSGHWSAPLGVFMIREYEDSYAKGVATAREHLPPNALVLGLAFSGALYFHTEFAVLRWDQVDASAFSRYRDLARKAGRPVYALLFDSEEKTAFERCAGRWSRVAAIDNVGLWRLDAGSD